jgi:peptide deformylase
MIKNIVKDEAVLVKKSEKFVFGQDDYIIDDMIDTAEAHSDKCVGLAAVQIGYLKRVILVRINNSFVPFINPTIIQKGGERYTSVEGCLSVDGEHEVKRNKWVRVKYQTRSGKTIIDFFDKFEARIIQHEVDHLNGVLI